MKTKFTKSLVFSRWLIISAIFISIAYVPIILADQYQPWWNNPRYYRPGFFSTIEVGERRSGACYANWQRDRFNGLVELRACN